MPFTMKKGDRRPYFRVQLTHSDPSDPDVQVPVDLTGASSVRFIMKQGASAPKVDAAAEFVDRLNGIVQYKWLTVDTDTSGTYNIEFEVDWGLGELQTFPSQGYFTATIADDLA